MKEVISALIKVQSELKAATKSKENPHFRHKYSDLADVWDACRELLAKNELCVIQIPTTEANKVTVKTMICHISGDIIEGELTMIAGQNTPHAIGSCITYARRYALTSMLGISSDDDDDDGNEAAKGAESVCYDPKNSADKRKLFRILQEKGIDSDNMPEIARKMEGMTWKDIVKKEICNGEPQ